MIKNFAKYPADQVLEKLFSEVNRFTKRAVQHDDMTMVVVRII